MTMIGREIKSFDNPEEVIDLLTGDELQAALVFNRDRGSRAAVTLAKQEIERRIDEFDAGRTSPGT
jgi:hypothetical protein